MEENSNFSWPSNLVIEEKSVSFDYCPKNLPKLIQASFIGHQIPIGTYFYSTWIDQITTVTDLIQNKIYIIDLILRNL